MLRRCSAAVRPYFWGSSLSKFSAAVMLAELCGRAHSATASNELSQKDSEEFLPAGEVQPWKTDTVSPSSATKSLLRRATQLSDFAGLPESAQKIAATQHSFLQQRQEERFANGNVDVAVGALGSQPDHTQRREFLGRHAASDITVWCGAHAATECTACIKEHGPSWCNGDCEWTGDACNFRQDLVWCGGHSAKTCGDCVSKHIDDKNGIWCNGECRLINQVCVPHSEAHLFTQWSPLREQMRRDTSLDGVSKKESPIRGHANMPDPARNFYMSLDGNTMHQQSYMAFYDYGCCRTSESTYRGSTMGAMSAHNCMQSCLLSEFCIAADIGGPAASPNSFECTMYSGQGIGFHTGCTPSSHCYQKVIPGRNKAIDPISTREQVGTTKRHLFTSPQLEIDDLAKRSTSSTLSNLPAKASLPQPATFGGREEAHGRDALAPQAKQSFQVATVVGNVNDTSNEAHASATVRSTKQVYTQRSQWERLEDQDTLHQPSSSPAIVPKTTQSRPLAAVTAPPTGQVDIQRSQWQQLKEQNTLQQPSTDSSIVNAGTVNSDMPKTTPDHVSDWVAEGIPTQSNLPASVTAPSSEHVSARRFQWEQLKAQDPLQQPSSVPSIVNTSIANSEMRKSTLGNQSEQVAKGPHNHVAESDPSFSNVPQSNLGSSVTAPSPEQVSNERSQWEQLKGQEPLQQPSSVQSIVKTGRANNDTPKDAFGNKSDQIAKGLSDGDSTISTATQTSNGPPIVNNAASKEGMIKDSFGNKPDQVATRINGTQATISASDAASSTEHAISQHLQSKDMRSKDALPMPSSAPSSSKETKTEVEVRDKTLANQSGQVTEELANVSAEFKARFANATPMLPASVPTPSTEATSQQLAAPMIASGDQSGQATISKAGSDLDSSVAKATKSKVSDTSASRAATPTSKTASDHDLGVHTRPTWEERPYNSIPLTNSDANANQSTASAKDIAQHDFAANAVFDIDSAHPTPETSSRSAQVEHAKLTSATGQDADQAVHASVGNVYENAYEREVTPRTLVSSRSESAGSARTSQDDSARMAKQLSSVDSSSAEYLSSKASMPANNVRDSSHSNTGAKSTQDASARMPKQLSSVDSSAAEHLSNKASMPASIVRDSSRSNNGAGSIQDASARMAKQLSSLDSNVAEHLPSKASMPASNVHEAGQSNLLKAAREDAATGRQQVDLHLTEDEEHELQEKIDTESEEMNFPSGSTQSAGQRFNFFSTSSMPINSDAQVAVQEFVIENIDYDRLLNKATILDQIKTKVRDLVADAAGDGVGPEHVVLNISKGSIRIRAEVTPPSDISLSSIIAALSTSTSLKDDVVQQIKSVPNIADVATGWISCSSVGTAAATTTVFQMLPGYVKETVDAPTDNPTPAPGSVPGLSKGEQSSIEDGSEEVRDAIEHDQAEDANATKNEGDEGWKLFGREMEWGVVAPILLVCCCVCTFGIGSVVMMAPPNSRALDHADQLQKHIESTANELPPQPYDNPSSSMMLPQSLQISGAGDADTVYDFTPDVLEGGWPVWKSKDRNLFIVTGRTDEWEIIECYGSQPNLDEDTIILRTFEPHGPRMPNNMPAWRRREGEEWVHDPAITMEALGQFIPYTFGVGPTGPLPNPPS